MSDGSKRFISFVKLGEMTRGGMVESIRTSWTAPGTRYQYKGCVVVTGSHAVMEDGKWLRVKDSKYAVPLAGGGVVYSLVTSDHRIYLPTDGDTIEAADEHETDQYETLTIDESLAHLNKKEEARV